jgi:hypothetical protein
MSLIDPGIGTLRRAQVAGSSLGQVPQILWMIYKTRSVANALTGVKRVAMMTGPMLPDRQHRQPSRNTDSQELLTKLCQNSTSLRELISSLKTR